MLLCEMKIGQEGVLLATPTERLPLALRQGKRVAMVMTRPELSVVLAGGVRYALSGALAREIIVVRAPT